MELQQLFLCLLGSTCVVHLLTMAVQTLQKSTGRRLSYHARSQTAAQTTRDDWYVFFHCADLLGTQSVSGPAQQKKGVRIAQAVDKRRQQAPRPRARVRM